MVVVVVVVVAVAVTVEALATEASVAEAAAEVVEVIVVVLEVTVVVLEVIGLADIATDDVDLAVAQTFPTYRRLIRPERCSQRRRHRNYWNTRNWSPCSFLTCSLLPGCWQRYQLCDHKQGSNVVGNMY